MTLLVGHTETNEPLTVPNGDHVLLLGPPASGKTSGFLVPSVLGHDGPVLVTSSTADGAARTRGRASRGRLWSFTIGTDALPGTTAVTWNPLDGCTAFDEAILRAEAMTQTVKTLQGSSREDALWFTLASRTLAALMHAAALDGRGPSGIVHVLDWVTRAQLESPQEILTQRGAGAAAAIVESVRYLDPRQMDSILITLVQCLRVFDSPAMQQQLRTATQLDVRSFVSSSDTLYVVAPIERQEFFAALIVGMVDAIARAAMARAGAEEDRPREHRSSVVLALDEVANIAPLHSLPRLVSAGGGQGVQILAVLQDLSQAKARWRDAADGFPTLFQHKVVLPGVLHAPTLEALATCLPHFSTGPDGHLVPEYPASRIAALRRHTSTAHGQALWIDGAVPRPVRILTIHDVRNNRR